MQHNHQRKFEEWLKKQQKEERLSAQLEVDENSIQTLRNYDRRLFLDARKNFFDNERVTGEAPTYDPVIITTPEKLLNEIKDVAVYLYLKIRQKTSRNINSANAR